MKQTITKIINLFKKGKVKELRAMTTGSGKQLMFIPENENDLTKIESMRKFGRFLERTGYVWKYYNNDLKCPVVCYGPMNKGYNLYFVKINDKWKLDQLIGGD